MKRLVVLQHVGVEGPGLFAKIAKKKGFKVDIIRLDLEENLPKLIKGDILLILGGPMGVKDIKSNKYPWLGKEIKLIKSTLKRDIGIIGVCLGAQLLSYSAGGDVELLKRGSPPRPFPEIGWSEIFTEKIYSCEEISCMLKKPMKVLHWHADRILLPRNSKLLASSNYCKEQLFKIGEKAYGLQFHIEYEVNMVYKWIEIYEEFIISALGKDGPEKLKNNLVNNEKETLNSRIDFINKLMELTI